jgi:hypothetical protein
MAQDGVSRAPDPGLHIYLPRAFRARHGSGRRCGRPAPFRVDSGASSPAPLPLLPRSYSDVLKKAPHDGASCHAAASRLSRRPHEPRHLRSEREHLVQRPSPRPGSVIGEPTSPRVPRWRRYASRGSWRRVGSSPRRAAGRSRRAPRRPSPSMGPRTTWPKRSAPVPGTRDGARPVTDNVRLSVATHGLLRRPSARRVRGRAPPSPRARSRPS